MTQKKGKLVGGTLNVRINLDRPIADLQGVLREALAKAAVGLTAAEYFQGPTDLPDIFPSLQLGSPIDPDEAKHLYTIWLHSSLLRECIEALEPLLSDVWMLATIVTLPGPDRLVHSTTLQDFDRALRNYQHHKTLGQKLDTLITSFPGLVPPGWEKALNGLICLRNCLTHGGGVVRVRDLTSTKRLVVGWKSLELILLDEEGNRHRLTAKAGEPLPSGYLGMRSRWRRRLFKVGDKPLLTRQDFSELLLSLLLFAYEVRDKLLHHLQQAGAAPPELDLTPKIALVTRDICPLMRAAQQWAQEVEPSVGEFEIHLPARSLASEDGPLQIRLRFIGAHAPAELLDRNRQAWEESLAQIVGTRVEISPHSPAERTIRLHPQ